MYNPIEEKRKFVKSQIEKSFNSGINISDELDLEKAWNIGDEKVYQGVTYVVGGFNAKGVPLWRKKKDGSGNSGTNNSKLNSSNISTASWWDDAEKVKQRIDDPLIQKTMPHLIPQLAARYDELKNKNAKKVDSKNNIASSNPKKKTDNNAFVDKTINKLKDVLSYMKISDERIKKLSEAISKDEITAKKIISVKFPPSGTVGPGLSYFKDTEVNKIGSYEEIICTTSKSYVTTSRGSSPYTTTYYEMTLRDTYSGVKKTLGFSSASNGRYKTPASTAKQRCIMESLLKYYGI